MFSLQGEVYTYKNCLILSNCKIDPATNSLQRAKGERVSTRLPKRPEQSVETKSVAKKVETEVGSRIYEDYSQSVLL